LANNLH